MHHDPPNARFDLKTALSCTTVVAVWLGYLRTSYFRGTAYHESDRRDQAAGAEALFEFAWELLYWTPAFFALLLVARELTLRIPERWLQIAGLVLISLIFLVSVSISAVSGHIHTHGK